MDMLFDPYSDGPFKAASAASARTKSRPEGLSQAAELGGGGTGHQGTVDGAQRSGGWASQHSQGGDNADQPHHRPNAAELLQGLNPQQEEAVKHAGSALLIVAGAGSGKTRVLS
ncbi:MAG: UvrD-helicase domain-containing protein, partial [Pseudarthrobacter sp.]